MTSNATSCSAWRLYVIVDPAAARGRDLAWVAEQAIRGGADVLQLRDKHGSADALADAARRLLAVTRPRRIPLIINDHPEVARAVGADGVHLGQEDAPTDGARRLLGPDAVIGRSTHSLAQALEADGQMLDYVALGPIYATPTKPDYGCVGPALIGEVAPRLRHPLVAIGGIEPARIAEVRRAGAACVAVVRAVCGAEDPCAAAQALKALLL